ncbi:MAG: RNA polymerase sigma factor [Planctomycetota bacterium]
MDFESELKKVLDELWRCSMFLMKNVNDAGDLYQSTIMLALKYYRKNKSPHILNFKKWIIAILFNQAKKIFKERKYISLDDIEEEPAEPHDSAPDRPLTCDIANIYESIKSDLSSIINNALSYLSPLQREILLAVDILEYNYREVAELLCIPIGTVMSNLHRARKKLKYILSNSLHKLRKI